MKRSSMTVTELSLLSGLHRNTIRNLLIEDSDPTLSTVSKLANSLGISPFALLLDVGDVTVDND